MNSLKLEDQATAVGADDRNEAAAWTNRQASEQATQAAKRPTGERQTPLRRPYYV